METEELSRLIVELYEKLSAWEDAAVRDSGLTTAQNHAIEIVGHHGAIQMKDLAAGIGVTTGTLTTTVDRLERKGLLKRVPHASDRRSFLIELTDGGRKVFKRHHTAHQGLTRELLAGQDDKDAARLGETVRHIIKTIDRDLADSED